VIVIREGDVRRLDIAAEETKTRGAYVIAISSSEVLDVNSGGSVYDQVIPISGDQLMYPILATLPLQYLAYLLSVRLGYNPDYPRNLAKCVTVE